MVSLYDITHEVIGQKFEGVCMILNNSFYYNDNLLKAKQHPNSNYLYERLLYQGLTRVRSKIALIVTTETMLDKILTLFQY